MIETVNKSHVNEHITTNVEKTYPDGFFDLFGTDRDPKMTVPEELSFRDDTERESVED